MIGRNYCQRVDPTPHNGSGKVSAMSIRQFVTLLGLSLGLAACASGIAADVTRFHLGQPLVRGSIAVVAPAAGPASLEARTYADAVATQLAALGFRPVDAVGQAELTAAVEFRQEVRSGGSRGSGFSIGIGGGTSSGGIGIGGGVTIPIGKAKPIDIAVSTLSLQIKRRADATVLWEGRAVSESLSSSPAASPGQVAPRLAAALLSGFPGPSGQTVRVKL